MNNIIKGFWASVKNRKLVYRLFLVYVLLYLSLYIIFSTGLSGLSYMVNTGEKLQNFNFTYLMLYISKHGEIKPIALALLFFAFILYFFYSQYVFKIFIERLSGVEKIMKNYRKVLLSWLYNLPIIAIILFLMGKLYMKSRNLITENPTLSSVFYYAFLILLPLLFVYALALLDSTRITSIVFNKNSFKAFLKSFLIVFKRYPLFLLIYLFYGIIALILFYFYTVITKFMGNALWEHVLILMFFQFLYFMLQLFVKFSITGSVFYLLKGKEKRTEETESKK